MANAATLDRLTDVLRDIFDDEELIATPELTARSVDGWDSLGNVRLFVELERVFGVRFSATEISSLKNVGQLAELLERKIARAKL
jgi:acyl carrier protein